jgi:hypothetical protein
MRVEFFKSDACAEEYPDEPDSLVLEFPHNVQLTYEELRTTREAKLSIGHFKEGDRVAYFSNDGYWKVKGNLTHWSDIVIGNEYD